MQPVFYLLSQLKTLNAVDHSVNLLIAALNGRAVNARKRRVDGCSRAAGLADDDISLLNAHSDYPPDKNENTLILSRYHCKTDTAKIQGKNIFLHRKDVRTKPHAFEIRVTVSISRSCCRSSGRISADLPDPGRTGRSSGRTWGQPPRASCCRSSGRSCRC